MPELTEEQRRILESVRGSQSLPNAAGNTQQFGAANLTPQQAQILQQVQGDTRPPGFQTDSKVDQAILSVPGMPAFLELGNSLGKSTAEIFDFFGPDVINDVMTVAGSERRVPTLAGTLEDVGALRPAGTYMPPSLTREMINKTGEAVPMAMSAQKMIREGLQAIPAAVNQVKSTGRRVMESIGSTRPSQEAIATTGGVIGSELGRETGIPGADVAGGLFLGSGTLPLVNGIETMFTSRQDLANTASNLSKVNKDIAAEILARSLRSSGMSPREAIDAYRALGPDAVPADISDSFRDVLRAAMNVDEGISGVARRSLTDRQRGSGERIASSMDLVNAGSIDEYISAVDDVMKPRIADLYAAAAATPLPLSGRLRRMMEGDNSLSRARQSAEARLADRRAVGDQVSHFDIIDETKRVLDDQIGSALRDGRRNEARNLIRLKNEMVREADEAIPEYAQARQMYAGRAALDDAARIGTEFFVTPRRELIDLTSTMTVPEKTAYALSAKDTILDRIDNTNMNRDQVTALFGRNGDAMKLRTLFDNQQSFDTFVNGLKRETEFMLTRRAAIGNSTTAAQLARMRQTLNPPGGFKQAIGSAVSVLTGGAQGIARETAGIVDSLNATKGSDEYINGLIKAGDLLLTSGMEPARLEALLRNGSRDRLVIELQRIAEPDFSRRSAGLVGTTAAGLSGETEE